MSDAIKGQPADDDGGLAGFLKPHHISGGCGIDIALARRAVKGRWPMSPETRIQMMRRLAEVVARRSAVIADDESASEMGERLADRNAIAAANVLRMMQAEDREYEMRGAEFFQRERFKEIDKAVPDQVEVNVKLWGKEAPIEDV